MKRVCLFCLVSLLSIPFLSLSSEEPVPAGFEHWNSSSLKTVAQALSSQAASDPHHVGVKQLADFPGEAILEVHRESDGQIEWHETQSDIFFVQSGTATLLVGGTYLNGETVAPHEKRNGTIQGGVREKLAAGDVVRIPPRVPHQVLLDGAHEFTYLVVKAKGY
jgi:mannose-6-phosphate isomerase-like protein (cupin superfamily)